MPRTIMLIPTDLSVGLTSVSLGVIRAMERQGVRLSLFKPVAQTREQKSTSAPVHAFAPLPAALPLDINYVEAMLAANGRDELMEDIVARYHQNLGQSDVVLIEGLMLTRRHQFASLLNYDIAKALNADVVFVTSPGTGGVASLKERLELARAGISSGRQINVVGVIINKINAPLDEQGRTRPDLSEIFDPSAQDGAGEPEPLSGFNNLPMPLLGLIPWSMDLIATRVIDIARHLNARIINAGSAETRRVKSVVFCARGLTGMVDTFRAGSLLVTCADRPEVLVAACLAAMNGVDIAAILLTGGYAITPSIGRLCERAFHTGLPVIMVNTNTWQTSLDLQNFNLDVPADDDLRLEKMQDYIAGFISPEWIASLSAAYMGSRRLSPPAFRYHITELARRANRRIVLPEGDEPRTLRAAAWCGERGIARCVLLGSPEEIHRVAAAQGVTLNDGIEIIDPAKVREKYIARLVELRQGKGMTPLVAHEQLKDNVMLGTLMLEQGEVDGLVSGARHTTAHTIRPALQIIKTAPGSSLVSSVFFMLMPEQVLVYGDCAINPDPDAAQLADIAIQSADSAAALGIEPRVAMISYSTGWSGVGSDVDKVREATRLAREKRPDLLIDGPLQYDAAIMADVAKSKAPDSPVAGKATVFVFPDLNTGNTTYKAVQRSATLISIGPMLQGMRKPVNDLSRGALVEDIVYTIALTAIQSMQLAGEC